MSSQIHSVSSHIRNLLAFPPLTGRCRGTQPVRLRHKTLPGERIMRLSCNCWKCRCCRQRLRLAAGLHFGRKLQESQGSLFRREYPAGGWSAMRKALQRQKASWIRIGCTGQAGVVLGAYPATGERIYTDRDEAVRDLGRALLALTLIWDSESSHCHPVRCSRDWTQSREPSAYDRIGWVRCLDPQALVASLTSAGIEARYRPVDTSGRLWDVTYAIPDDPELLVELESILRSHVPDSLSCRTGPGL